MQSRLDRVKSYSTLKATGATCGISAGPIQSDRDRWLLRGSQRYQRATEKLWM